MARTTKGGTPLRSGSSPPSRGARAAAERAAVDASTARVAAEQAEESAAIAASLLLFSQSLEDSREATRRGRVYWDGPQQFPPVANSRGQRFFYAFDHEDLADGIYTCLALRRRGVDPEQISSRTQGWAGEQAAFRRSSQAAYRVDFIHWW